MSKKGFVIQELIDRPVIRPDLPCEWLTKISFKEFNYWAQGQASIIKFRGGTSREAVNLHIETEIGEQEKLYQALKLVGSMNGLKKSNGVAKWQGEIKLGGSLYDIASIPSTRNAVLRVDDYKPMTASTKYDKMAKEIIYDMGYKKQYTKKSVPENWMTGGYNPF